MLDAEDYKAGIRGAVESYDRVKGQCSILYESSVLLYHIINLHSENYTSVRARARALLAKIKSGGLVTDMRVAQCRELAQEKPELFTSYALLVAKLMELSGGEDAYSAAYIRSLDK